LWNVAVNTPSEDVEFNLYATTVSLMFPAYQISDYSDKRKIIDVCNMMQKLLKLQAELVYDAMYPEEGSNKPGLTTKDF
jgi:hypothetical protein